MLAPIGSSFDLALGNFKHFFKLKTKIEWDQRLGRQNMGPEAFIYSPPRGGGTQGVMPPYELPNNDVHLWENKVVENDNATVGAAFEAYRPQH